MVVDMDELLLSLSTTMPKSEVQYADTTVVLPVVFTAAARLCIY